METTTDVVPDQQEGVLTRKCYVFDDGAGDRVGTVDAILTSPEVWATLPEADPSSGWLAAPALGGLILALRLTA